MYFLGHGNVEVTFVFLEHHYWSSPPPLRMRELSLSIIYSRISLIPALDNENHYYSGVIKPSTEASRFFLMMYQHILIPCKIA